MSHIRNFINIDLFKESLVIKKLVFFSSDGRYFSTVLLLLKTFNLEFNSSNEAILVQRKIQGIFLCSLGTFDQSEVPDSVYDCNLQSLVGISLAFKKGRMINKLNREGTHQYSSLVHVQNL